MDRRSGIAQCLRWYQREEATDEYDRRVEILKYEPAGIPAEYMGYVAEHTAHGPGVYYWCVVHAGIISKNSSSERLTIREAEAGLHEYVLSQLYALWQALQPRKPSRRRKLAKDEVRASSFYLGSGSDSFLEGFNAGIDYAAKTLALPDKPLWARYVAQNRDGSITWFENMPERQLSKGCWQAEGQSLTLAMSDDWNTSARCISFREK